MENNQYPSIAIDGPAASGKSTAAKRVAKALGFVYVDTGAMYRAFTLYLIESGLDPKAEASSRKLLPSFAVREDERGHVFLNGKDVTDRVRKPDVSSLVSYSCAFGFVRERMVEIQKDMAKSASVVMDGRDIGTVVLPDAALKIYQTASSDARAMRRYKENIRRGIPSDLAQIKEEIEKRDYLDSHRKVSPLKPAEDSILLDTSDMTIEEAVDKILSLYKDKTGK